MKALSISLLVLFLLVAAVVPGYATVQPGGSYEFSGSLGFASGPGSFDDDWGLSIGAGYMLNNIDNLQARIDLSYFAFERDVFGADLEYTRIPIAFGGRYYFASLDSLNLFAEGALEVSFDDVETVGGSDSEVNLGITPGAGAEFFLSDAVSLFTAARFHVISDDYVSIHFGGAYHF